MPKASPLSCCRLAAALLIASTSSAADADLPVTTAEPSPSTQPPPHPPDELVMETGSSPVEVEAGESVDPAPPPVDEPESPNQPAANADTSEANTAPTTTAEPSPSVQPPPHPPDELVTETGSSPVEVETGEPVDPAPSPVDEQESSNQPVANADTSEANTASATFATHSFAESERESLMRLGQMKLEQGDTESAIIAFRSVAKSDAPTDVIITAHLGLARSYNAAGESIKAVATYEHLMKKFEAGMHTPIAHIEAGRVLRDLGSSKLALARFYSVIHTTLKLADTDGKQYRELVRQAQFEIAETHLLNGDYDEAVKFFRRFDLLDARESDLAWARLRTAHALDLSGDKIAAAKVLRNFIAKHPDNDQTPEAYFRLAQLLDELNQHNESLRVTLTLLQQVKSDDEENQENWRHWQQRTGNQLAHAFFERGEYGSALILYQALAHLNDSVAWLVPLLYQEGLCHERLMQFEFARDSYAIIAKLTEDATENELLEIRRMADWRTRQLDWWSHTQTELNALNPVATPPNPS